MMPRALPAQRRLPAPGMAAVGTLCATTALRGDGTCHGDTSPTRGCCQRAKGLTVLSQLSQSPPTNPEPVALALRVLGAPVRPGLASPQCAAAMGTSSSRSRPRAEEKRRAARRSPPPPAQVRSQGAAGSSQGWMDGWGRIGGLPGPPPRRAAVHGGGDVTAMRQPR